MCSSWQTCRSLSRGSARFSCGPMRHRSTPRIECYCGESRSSSGWQWVSAAETPHPRVRRGRPRRSSRQPSDTVSRRRSRLRREQIRLLAELVCANQETLVPKPANVSFEEAAATPTAGYTALQGLRKGRIAAGQKVLIDGASGGVGTFAIQIAQAYGADVTAVCSTRNVEIARALGAYRPPITGAC
jgi:hypothetical protein